MILAVLLYLCFAFNNEHEVSKVSTCAKLISQDFCSTPYTTPPQPSPYPWRSRSERARGGSQSIFFPPYQGGLRGVMQRVQRESNLCVHRSLSKGD
jgi:hypothetical protein